MGAPATWLSRPPRENGHAARLELLRVTLVLTSREHVDLVRHHDIGEAGLIEEHPPLCIQQSTGNSATPERDVILRVLRDLLMYKDVPDLDAPAGLENTEHFVEDGTLIGTEVDHTVADDDVGEAIVDGQRFRKAVADFDVGEPHLARAFLRLLAHLGGHVHGDDPAARPDLLRGDQSVEASAAANVDDAFANAQIAEQERVPRTGKRCEVRSRQAVDALSGITEHQSQRAAGVKVESELRIGRDLAVLLRDESTELRTIDTGNPDLGRHFFRSVETSRLVAIVVPPARFPPVVSAGRANLRRDSQLVNL